MYKVNIIYALQQKNQGRSRVDSLENGKEGKGGGMVRVGVGKRANFFYPIGQKL